MRGLLKFALDDGLSDGEMVGGQGAATSMDAALSSQQLHMARAQRQGRTIPGWVLWALVAAHVGFVVALLVRWYSQRRTAAPMLKRQAPEKVRRWERVGGSYVWRVRSGKHLLWAWHVCIDAVPAEFHLGICGVRWWGQYACTPWRSLGNRHPVLHPFFWWQVHCEYEFAVPNFSLRPELVKPKI